MRDLDSIDLDVIGGCLRAVADGPFFEDWEFSTLFGLGRAELREVATRWPSVDILDDLVRTAVQNAMVNLLGYPHWQDEALLAYVSGGPVEVERVLARWREAG